MLIYSAELFSNPRFSECWSDPRRLFNQDETSLCVGSGHEKVLAPKGYREPLYKLTTSSRIHVSCSFIVSASGHCANVTLVYRGKINVAKGKLKDMIKDGLSRTWSVEVTENGFVTRVKFLLILKDLVKYLGRLLVKLYC